VDIPHFQADPYLINLTALVYVVALPKNPKNSIALGKSCGTSEALGGSRCCLRPLSHAQQHPQGWEWRFSNMIPELLGLWRMIFVDVRFHVSFHGCKACGNESLRTGVDALVVGFLQQQLLHTCLKFYLSETRFYWLECIAANVAVFKDGWFSERGKRHLGHNRLLVRLSNLKRIGCFLHMLHHHFPIYPLVN